MQDRIPTYPGRWKLTNVATGEVIIVDAVRADDATQDGTPMNKATFLKDATAALFGLTALAVPDDVLAAIASGRAKIETGSYNGTGVYGSANKNTLSFSLTPKIVVIYRRSTSSGFQMVMPYIYGEHSFWTGTMSTNQEQIVSISGNTMSWYSNGGNASYQLNVSGLTYYYAAIGV